MRRKADLFDTYGFIACDARQTAAARVRQRPPLKGEKEQLFGEVWSGLDLHRPPCSALIAHQLYYLIAALAYDLRVAIKLMDLNDACQSWRIKTLLKQRVLLPGRLSPRARQWGVQVLVPGAGWCGWQRGAERAWPGEQGPERPCLTVASG